ncbi:hypothetical protein [Flavobacterium sp.]|uniref:hypothetical protein n=1 Tax=Flavobacterium sp. TaxID=239 RepID=UPI0033428439
MREYLAKIRIPEEIKKESTGFIGEKIFELWFTYNFQDEPLFKQKADMDLKKIDFADSKGCTYQVKTTAAKTYTFNCDLEDIHEHLNSSKYVFIQLRDDYAYIEPIYGKEDIKTKLKRSFKEKKQCFIYCKDLLQKELFI